MRIKSESRPRETSEEEVSLLTRPDGGDGTDVQADF